MAGFGVIAEGTQIRWNAVPESQLVGCSSHDEHYLLRSVAEDKGFLQVSCPARECRELAVEPFPFFMADERDEMLLHLLPPWHRIVECTGSLRGERDKTLSQGRTAGNGYEAPLLEQPQIAREGRWIDQQQLRQIANAYWLRPGNGQQNGKLRCPQARCLERRVVNVG